MEKNNDLTKTVSPEEFIRNNARMIPLGKCYISDKWRQDGESVVLVTRCHENNRYTVGLYIVDTFCIGLKDTYFYFSIAKEDVEEILDNKLSLMDMRETEYAEVHNIIYRSIDFAEEGGIKPHPGFNVTQYILCEDDDRVPFIEHVFGIDGKHVLSARNKFELSLYGYELKKKLGEEFEFMLPQFKFPHDGSMLDEVLSRDYADTGYDDFDYSDDFDDLDNLDDFDDFDKYSYVSDYSFPSYLVMKNRWIYEEFIKKSNDLHLNDELLKCILAIPSDELKRDLENILLYEGGFEEDIKNGYVDKDYNPALVHSIILLGEVGDEKSLDILLEILKLHPDFINYHLEDYENEICAPTLYKLGKNHLDKLYEFMKIKGISIFSKSTVASAVSIIANNDPSMRSEALEWFEKVLLFYEDKFDVPGYCDSDLIKLIVYSLVDSRAVELLPLIKSLYDEEFLTSYAFDGYEEIEACINGGSCSMDLKYKINLLDRYESLREMML